jgi:hypothetical protein
MRKILLPIAFCLILGVSPGIAQVCTPFPIPLPGVYPNPLITSSLPDGQVGSTYGTTITAVVIKDTTLDLSVFLPGAPTLTVAVAYQRISNVTGLPPGLSYACNISSCDIPGDSSGCVQISGIPTAAGSYTVGLVTSYGIEIPTSVPLIGGTIQNLPIPGISWTMDVMGGVGIEELAGDRFSVVQNGPNPFRGSTDVYYNTPKPGQVSLTVMDISGRVLHERTVRAAAGQNVLSIDASGYAPGIYLFRLSNGEQSVTQKMIVTE